MEILGKQSISGLNSSGYSDLLARRYDSLIQVSPKFAGLGLDHIVHAHHLGRKFVRDVKALQPSSPESGYKSLEKRLVNYLESNLRVESYSIVGVNLFGDRFISLIEYIEFIEGNFSTDARQTKKLKSTIIETFRGKSRYNPEAFIPERLKPLYVEVYDGYMTEKRGQRTSELFIDH